MSTDNKNMEWMYEGAKALVNREDYLLGKRIDKDFEMYSDVVVKEKDHLEELVKKKPEQEPSVLLPALVVRQDDPLFAMKLQEAKRREQILNNPELKLKAERILREEFEKMKRKAEKKEKKKKEKKRAKHDKEDGKKHHKRDDKRQRTSEKHHERDEKHHKKERRRSRGRD